jgi:hypothetical protein
MRSTIICSFLFCLACSRGESPPAEAKPESTTETEAAAADQSKTPDEAQELPSLAPPSVELISAGEPPRRLLRWNFEKGVKERVRISIKSEATAGERAPFLFPAIGYDLTVVAKDVTPDGMVRVEFKVDEIQYPEVSADFPTESLEALKKSLGPAKGKKGAYLVDPRGVVSRIHLDPKGEGDEHVERLFRKLLDRSSVPVPEEEIGSGGTWTVTRVIEEEGVRFQEVLTVELTKMEASRIEVSLKIDQTAPRQVLSEGPGVPPGGSLTVLKRETEGTGRGTYDLAKLSARSSTIETLTQMSFFYDAATKPLERSGTTVITTTRQ